MTKLADLKKKLMTDPETQEEYARADIEFAQLEASLKVPDVPRQGTEPDQEPFSKAPQGSS